MSAQKKDGLLHHPMPTYAAGSNPPPETQCVQHPRQRADAWASQPSEGHHAPRQQCKGPQALTPDTAGVRSSSDSVSMLCRWLRAAAGSMGSSSRSMLDLHRAAQQCDWVRLGEIG